MSTIHDSKCMYICIWRIRIMIKKIKWIWNYSQTAATLTTWQHILILTLTFIITRAVFTLVHYNTLYRIMYFFVLSFLDPDSVLSLRRCWAPGTWSRRRSWRPPGRTRRSCRSQGWAHKPELCQELMIRWQYLGLTARITRFS